MPFDAEVNAPSKDKLVLQRARDIVAAGWAQGGSAESGLASYRENESSHCAMNALCISLCDMPGRHGLPAFEHAAQLLGFDWLGAVWAWNDAPGRTKVEVIARFDEAIARLG